MDTWRSVFLGARELPHVLSGFELQAFFSFDRAEREAIDARQSDPHRLGLALPIGFLPMSGRLLDTFRTVPSNAPRLFPYLGWARHRNHRLF
jgi:hypothetical protein